MTTLLLVLYLLAVPLAVMLLAKKWKWIESISPMTVLYIIGLIVGNTATFDKGLLSTNNTIGSIAIPFAIPLMLMGCGTGSWSTKKAVKVFLSGLSAVCITIVAGYFLFRGQSDPRSFAQVSAVSMGLYTGGIPNVGAIAKGVGIKEDLFLYITTYDLIATGIYLVFVIFFGKIVFRKLLPAQGLAATTASQKTEQAPKKKKNTAITLLLTLVIVAISYCLSTFFSPNGETNMTILILTLTTLAIAASFLKPVKQQTQSFDIGLYCVYVFCLSIATACNIREMDILGSLNILGYIFFVIFGSLILQIIFAKLLKIDGDSILVSSVALINSPPFVPMVAAILNNKDIVVLGITIGLLGYMLGNYLGIGIYQILMLLN